MTKPRSGSRPERVPDDGFRLRFPGLSRETTRLLTTAGEAQRFEFKMTTSAVTPRVLVAAANAAALEGLPGVTILVGVAEEKDPDTGAVTGRVTGLRDIANAERIITDHARETRPVPVGLTIFQENLDDLPILRVEVAPTRAPHYDAEGRRVTRIGAATRPITDEELVGLYLDREADAFAARFRRTALEITGILENLQEHVATVSTVVDEVDKTLGQVHELAGEAAGSAEETFDFLASLNETLGRIEDQVAPNELPSMEQAWGDLLRAREYAVLAFSALRRHHAQRARRVIQEVLAQPLPTLLDYERVLAETGAWQRLGHLNPEASATEWLKAAEAVRRAVAFVPRTDAALLDKTEESIAEHGLKPRPRPTSPSR